jgi:hypothetical protein
MYDVQVDLFPALGVKDARFYFPMMLRSLN